jgi:ABC-type amino acid transport substrate-binding protein
MGRIQRAGEIVVGIEANLSPYSSLDQETGRAEGFAVELAHAVAAALGVRATFVGGTGSQLVTMVTEEEVDLAFPAIPITESFLRSHRLTQVVYVGHQRLLVRAGSGVTGVESLTSKKACSFINADTQVPLQETNEQVKVVESVREQCGELLADGEVDAVTGSDLHLMSLAARLQDVEIVGDQLSTEGYGAVTPSRGMSRFVNNTFSNVKSDGRWGTFYRRWLAPFSDSPDREPPELTAEEAAALYPADLD